MGCQVQERGACGQSGANGEFFGLEPASCKKGRQERRGESERTEKCGVEGHKSKQCAALNGHGSAGSLRGLALGAHGPAPVGAFVAGTPKQVDLALFYDAKLDVMASK